jgi:hypothetical protein
VDQRQADQARVAALDREIARRVDERERLVKPDRDVGLDPLDQAHRDPRLALGRGTPSRVVAAPRSAPPAVGEVAVQVDAARVLPRVRGPAVRVQARQDPQVEEGPRPAASQPPRDPNPRALVAVDAADHEHADLVGIASMEDSDRPALVGLAEQLPFVDGRRRPKPTSNRGP